MTLPTVLFAFLIALFYGALYHLIRSGGFWRLVLYFTLSTIGFAIGHLVGMWRGWSFLPLGTLNLGLSSLGSFVILILGDWLSRIEAKGGSKVSSALGLTCAASIPNSRHYSALPMRFGY